MDHMRINRGESSKLTLSISEEAKKKIVQVSNNTAVAKGVVMAWALSIILDNLPSLEEFNSMEKRINLDKKRTSITLNPKTINRCKRATLNYGNRSMLNLFSYLISNFFEEMPSDHALLQDYDNVKVNGRYYISSDLYNKMDQLNKTHFTKISLYVSLSVLSELDDIGAPLESTDKQVTYIPLPKFIKVRIEEYATQNLMSQTDVVNTCLHKYLKNL
ncbi:hypothetical protein BCJMU07_p335 (plasmid) [Bacillus cereus]|nr:hypothetical protein BCJMU07_p335 [Bacillus cereus]BCD32899.1 hypothetical protein BC30102_p328 [Bacillus cereus]